MAVEDEKRPLKRKTNPGVRVVGGRIYDSSNGKTCHQCRQKTMDFVASCKAMNKDKQCTNNYCHNCLSNRYGENAEEVQATDDWPCPKCRCICNCSVCRKKRGQNPTGILAHEAKASGLSSVSELLEVKGFDNFAYQRKAKPEDVPLQGSSNDNNDSIPKTDVELLDVPKENIKPVVKVRKTKVTNKPEEEIEVDVELPQGTILTNILGIDIPPEEAGNVLQFLEFCSAFGKVLELKEGHAKSVVAELFSTGRKRKRQQHSSVIQMMIKLLDMISRDRDMSLSLSASDKTWFEAVGDCLLQSGVSADVFPPETFELGVSEYHKMDATKRLKLVNFLCVESLSTLTMRNFIDTESAEAEKKKKETKQKAAAAKQKEKQLKQKMQSEIYKAHMEKNVAPLSIKDHEEILSKIKAESKQAHDEMMEAKGMTSKNKQSCDAVRTEPVLVDDNGIVLWKLNCYEDEPKYLLQERGSYDGLCSHVKWYGFKPEQKEEIEKYISAKKMKQVRAQKNANLETK
ncbi:unnamed protein product [Cochlearia groenlandica]